MNQSEEVQRQLHGMALMLQLQRMARNSEDALALGFQIVNETRSLVVYRQAALWVKQPLSRIASVSGVAQLDAHAPYIVWLRKLAESLHVPDADASPLRLSAEAVSAELAAEWSSWSAEYGLWLPMRDSVQGLCYGGLLLFRETAWQDAEALLLAELVDAYAQAWMAFQPRQALWQKPLIRPEQRRWLWALPLLLLLPVRQTVLAPAEIIATDPTLVRASLEGVVSEFHVQPNQAVSEGQLLVSLDNTDIENRLDIARKALAVAETEYRSTAQLAVLDSKSKIDLNVLKGKIDQQAAEVAYMEDQLLRSQIKAPHAGIAIFTDAQDWLGKPVIVGERILQIANPQRVELQMNLPVADLINFDQDADTTLFLNSDPQHPLSGQLYYASYQAEMTEDNVQSYRLKAHLQAEEQPPRIGLKGTAKIAGQRVSLFYYVFRRPMAVVRQWLGL